MLTNHELREVLYLQLKINGFNHPSNKNIAIQLAQLNLAIHRANKD